MSASSLAEFGYQVLCTAEPEGKALLTQAAQQCFDGGCLPIGRTEPPERPARPATPFLLPARAMPKRPAGTLQGRIALIHALAHIELNAIDLAWDMLCRFGSGMPPGFSRDWLSVASDEAKHFRLLSKRLTSLGSHYGALPAHDGLWAAAGRTAHDVLARLAVVPLVLEARGLDVTPGMIARLRMAGDGRSARILSLIAREEIRHVRTGWLWFDDVARRRGLVPKAAFAELVRLHHAGRIKPPFNIQARAQAGLSEDFYLS